MITGKNFVIKLIFNLCFSTTMQPT